MDWLDQQRPGSVIYVSFGSWVAPIGSDEISELALGLEATGRPFLWVLKNDPSWRAGLPAGYLETVTGRGKVVAWAPQGGVLAHEAVGCYLTHCGWNSTLEAIQHGVRLLCYPVSGDQFINSAFIVKMWETGIRLRSTRRCDVKDGIGRIMEGDDGRRLQQKMYELRERVMAGEARFVAKRNLEAFVDGIKRDDLPFHQLAAKVYTPPSQIVVPA
jgi:UDP:flavonoid glycosyltransferase YjiC (YdhE family)